MSKTIRDLRIALVYHGNVVFDKTMRGKSEVTLGLKRANTVNVPLYGISEGFSLFKKSGGNNYTLTLTDQMSAKLRINGENYHLDELIDSGKASSAGSASVAQDGNEASMSQASVYQVDVGPGDWGVIEFGGVELVFQFVMPKGAVLSASSVGGFLGAIGMIIRGAASLYGMGLLLSFAFLVGGLFYIFYTVGIDVELEAYGIEEDRAMVFSSKVDEEEDQDQEDPEIPDEDAPEVAVVEEAPAAPEDEEGKFGEEDKTEESKLAEENGSPIVGENNPDIREVLGETGLDSLTGATALLGANAGEMFGEGMDAFMTTGDADATAVGHGFGGLGLAGTGRGGGGMGGPGAKIGGLKTGRGGKGRGGRPGVKKKKAKVKPKLKLAAPKAGNFCKAADIRKVVSKRAGALRNCYERQLLADPKLAGKIIMKWKIMLDGSVKDEGVKNTTMNNAKVERCLARVLKRLRFVKPDGGICVVEYPFTFVASE